MVKRIPTRDVDKSAATNFLGKAQQFSRAMLDSQSNGDWDAAGPNAVHCAISANDAVLVFTKGIRSASSKHDDSAMLLESMVQAPGTCRQSPQGPSVSFQISSLEGRACIFFTISGPLRSTDITFSPAFSTFSTVLRLMFGPTIARTTGFNQSIQLLGGQLHEVVDPGYPVIAPLGFVPGHKLRSPSPGLSWPDPA